MLNMSPTRTNGTICRRRQIHQWKVCSTVRPSLRMLVVVFVLIYVVFSIVNTSSLATTTTTTAFQTVSTISFGMNKVPTTTTTTATMTKVNSKISNVQVPLKMSDIPNEHHNKNDDNDNDNNNKPMGYPFIGQYVPVQQSVGQESSSTSTSNGLLLFFTKKINYNNIKKLPPKPEDIFVLIGDLLSISIYGFFDHFLCQDIIAVSVKNADSPVKLGILLSKISPQATTAINTDYLLSTPVWIDSATTPNLSHILQITVADQLVTHYSPLLQQTGLAVTALATCWLTAGWFHQAFAFRNTLSCRTDTALVITAKTWVTCSVLLFTLTAVSHYLCGCENILSFTKGDVDYIIDSLSVLVMWRFMASTLLGTGGGSSR